MQWAQEESIRRGFKHALQPASRTRRSNAVIKRSCSTEMAVIAAATAAKETFFYFLYAQADHGAVANVAACTLGSTESQGERESAICKTHLRRGTHLNFFFYEFKNEGMKGKTCRFYFKRSLQRFRSM